MVMFSLFKKKTAKANITQCTCVRVIGSQVWANQIQSLFHLRKPQFPQALRVHLKWGEALLSKLHRAGGAHVWPYCPHLQRKPALSGVLLC